MSHSAPRRPRRQCLALAFALLTSLSACGTATAPGAGEAGLEPYVAFLERGHLDPVDYVASLLADHDLVLLCERWHAETTQYEFILRLLRDPRLRAQVGRVYTEVGSSSLQPELDAVMAATDLDAGDLERRLLAIHRRLDCYSYWDKGTSLVLLRGVWALNRTLPVSERVEIRFCDMPFDWDEVRTPDQYREHPAVRDRWRRDRVMAEQIAADFGALDGGRRKALAILNGRHAYNDFVQDDGRRSDNAGRYLFEAFPGRVANVLLNSPADVGGDDKVARIAAIRGGRWDAAFARCGDPAVGFDLAGSPFGRDPFDLYPYRTRGVRYEQVFTGMVFLNPLGEHRLHWHVPRLFEDGFLSEYRRRNEILGTPVSEAEARARVREFERRQPRQYPGIEAIEAEIRRWLDAPPAQRSGGR